VLLVDAALLHSCVQHLQPFLALATADDLAHPRREHTIAATVLPSSFTRM
jgi:hypothetical protein